MFSFKNLSSQTKKLLMLSQDIVSKVRMIEYFIVQVHKLKQLAEKEKKCFEVKPKVVTSLINSKLKEIVFGQQE